MLFFKSILLFSAFQSISAQRPAGTSLCDYYTTQIFQENTAANEQLLIARMFNEAVRGNYTAPNIGIPVPGFATPAFYNGSWVNLIQYFTGQLNSTNDGVTPNGISRLFLDDGGPAPLAMDLPSSGNISSYQYKLFTHAYYLWGELLDCSQQGADDFPFYNGKQSMYEVHKYMNLDPLELGFFISQNVLSAFAIGFSETDAAEFGDILSSLFAYRCSPPRKIADRDPGPTALQSCCLAPECPIDPNGGNCELYPDLGVSRVPVNITVPGGGNQTVTPKPTGVSTSSSIPSSDILTSGGGSFSNEGRKLAGIVGMIMFGILF